VFSPDGTSIVFSYDRNSFGFLGKVNADGSGIQEFTLPMSVSSPSFYADGNNVLVIRRSASFFYDQLAKVNLITQTITGLASSLGTEACAIANRAVLSPDGTKAAFDARTSVGGSCAGPSRIFVMLLPSGPVNQLTDYPATPNTSDGFPTWVGLDQVGYTSTFGGAEQVYTLPASTTKSSGSLKVPTASEPWFGPN
jgi:Tol biopolymer transport system component